MRNVRQWATLVITSPPYANNYDYADATRLEMAFMGEIRGWGDLQETVRRHLVRRLLPARPAKLRRISMKSLAASQNSPPSAMKLWRSAGSFLRSVGAGREENLQQYDRLLFPRYRADVEGALRRVCASPSEVCFVIGDSAPYGVYVPVIDGSASWRCCRFDSWKFNKLRDRNIKWKNRKHRVPLCEGMCGCTGEAGNFMAESLAHRWGQIIGDGFEMFVRKILVRSRSGMDYTTRFQESACGERRSGQSYMARWLRKQARPRLCFRTRRNGEKSGVPIAFIESAWRRYTKHSKNKVQEIEAAVMPIALTFSRHQPFCGAVLAGEFTRNALHQLESKGFGVLHIPYDSILEAFRELGIDASSEDGVGGTTEKQFREKISKWESQPQPQAINKLLAKLHALHKREIADFKQRLEAALTRQVASVRLTVLRGHSVECLDVGSAIAYLIEEEKSYRLREDGEQREAFEVQVRFNTGAKIEATFPKRAEAIAFLRGFT